MPNTAIYPSDPYIKIGKNPNTSFDFATETVTVEYDLYNAGGSAATVLTNVYDPELTGYAGWDILAAAGGPAQSLVVGPGQLVTSSYQVPMLRGGGVYQPFGMWGNGEIGVRVAEVNGQDIGHACSVTCQPCHFPGGRIFMKTGNAPAGTIAQGASASLWSGTQELYNSSHFSQVWKIYLKIEHMDVKNLGPDLLVNRAYVNFLAGINAAPGGYGHIGYNYQYDSLIESAERYFHLSPGATATLNWDFQINGAVGPGGDADYAGFKFKVLAESSFRCRWAEIFLPGLVEDSVIVPGFDAP